MRIRCRAVLLDAGGVIVLPDRDLVAGALAEVGIAVAPAAVPTAHYEAVRRLDRDPDARRVPDAYLQALCAGLEVPARSRAPAVQALSRLADRRASGRILWSEPAPGAIEAMTALARAGITVLIVTNSDGHAAENLRDAGICQTGAGPGARVTDVIDSGLVGSAKPDPGIFATALRRAGAAPASAVHVGDTLSADVAGAVAAEIAPIHLDPRRACRSRDHRHVRSLAGIWRHVTAHDSGSGCAR
jgi:putative hydrolase of the HAD superfamily